MTAKARHMTAISGNRFAGPDWLVVVLAAGLLAGGTAYMALMVPGGKPVLYLLGAGIGVALYHAAFGFTAGWRRMAVDRRGADMRAQLALFALGAVLVMPVLASGNIFGHAVAGAVAPVGVAMVLGAFIFGFGMQLGNGCASGTLFTVGGGSVRMVGVLVFFVIGSVIGSQHLPWWIELPRLPRISLISQWGLWPALAATLAAIALIGLATVLIEKARHRNVRHETRPVQVKGKLVRRVIRGPWPIWWGVGVLGLLAFATIAITGHTWSISFGFALWGAKALGVMGIDLSQSEFWTWGYPSRALAGSIFAEDTSVMNMGMITGAALAAGLAGTFDLNADIAWRPALAAVLGGLAMGYGARLASGCNIGALFSGVISGSLHGWAWFAAGFAGSWLGIRARPFFGLG